MSRAKTSVCPLGPVGTTIVTVLLGYSWAAVPWTKNASKIAAKTDVLTCSPILIVRLLRFDLRFLHDLRDARAADLDSVAQLFGARADGLEAVDGEALLRLGHLQHLDRVGVQLRDDRRGRARRREQAHLDRE